MNHMRTAVVACLTIGLACGCASQPSTRLSSTNDPAGVDVEYVSAVESRARIAGVDVHWVNAPTKYRSKRDD